MTKSTIFYFNPTCELAVVNGSFSYMPPLLLQEMESDLSILPFVFGTEDDYILTENPPSTMFVQRLKDAGFVLPRFCSLTELESLPSGSFDNICPWGWSPAAHFKLKNLKEKCSSEFRKSPVYNWRKEHRILYERSTSLDFLNRLLKNNPPDWFIDQSLTGVPATSCEEIEILLLKIQKPLVIKAPVSSSGRGIQIIRKTKLSDSNKQWISGILKQQNYLIIEPYLEKLSDLSFQFLIKDHAEIDYLGYSVFETNSNGQYKSTTIHPALEIILQPEDFSVLGEKINITARILMEALKKSVYVRHYRGYVGIDSILFRKEDRLMIQPCIEVNCRVNMGIINLMLEEKIYQGSSGKFELSIGKPGHFNDFTKEQSRFFPLHFSKGKISSGFLPLVEPDPKKKFGAYALFWVLK